MAEQKRSAHEEAEEVTEDRSTDPSDASGRVPGGLVKRGPVWIHVAGSGATALPPELRAMSEQLGVAIARLGYGLQTGGWPGVDHAVSEAFAGANPNTELNDNLRYTLFDRGAASYPYGARKPLTPGDDPYRESVRIADVVVLIGGAKGTRRFYEAARAERKPVFPLPTTGGTARQAFNELVSNYENDDPLGDEYSDLNGSDLRQLDDTDATDGTVRRVVEHLTDMLAVCCKPAREIGIRVEGVNDGPSPHDTLGFGPYVRAVARFLSNKATTAPLTMSVEGAWGSGKSSFMLQLQNELEGLYLRQNHGPGRTFLSRRMSGRRTAGRSRGRVPGAQPEHCYCTFRFNAWSYSSQEALWAAFAVEFLHDLSRKLTWPRRLRSHLFLCWHRFDWRGGWFDVARFIVGVALFFSLLAIALPKTNSLFQSGGKASTASGRSGTPPAGFAGKRSAAKSDTGEEMAGGNGKSERDAADSTPGLLMALFKSGTVPTLLVVALWLIPQIKKLSGNPLAIDLKRYVKHPDYESNVGFTGRFQEDLRYILDSYHNDRLSEKIYVFIDDLDRCEIPVAADLMSALHLLMNSMPGVVFILGLDREKVAASLAVKYEKLLPYLAQTPALDKETASVLAGVSGINYGYSFLEKFIQVPFRVPRPGKRDLGPLLDTLMARNDANTAPAETGIGASRRKFTTAPSTEPGDVRRGSGTSNADSRKTEGQGGQIPSEQGGEDDTSWNGDTLRVVEDSLETKQLKEIVLTLAPSLDYNPRRIKQFVNLFRLTIFLSVTTGLYQKLGDAEKFEEDVLPKLGKFVALSLAFPRLLVDLEDDPSLLKELQVVALRQAAPDSYSQKAEVFAQGRPVAPGAPPDVRRETKMQIDWWAAQSGLLDLLAAGCVSTTGCELIPRGEERWSLADLNIALLLQVSAPTRRPSTSVAPNPVTAAPSAQDETVFAA